MKESQIPATHPYRSDEALRSRYEAKPNYRLRRAVAVAGIGVAAVVGVVSFKMAERAHEQDVLKSELTQPLPNVAADIKAGKIDPDEVTKVRIPHTEYAWTAASDLTHRDHQLDTSTVSEIIQAQQGDMVPQGAQVVVPNSEIDSPK